MRYLNTSLIALAVALAITGCNGSKSSDGFVSLSFHSRHGTVFYALTDRATTRGGFDLVVATADQLAAMEAKDTDEEPPQELRVLAPGRKGFVLARALAPQPSAYDDAAAQIAEMTCAIEPLEAR